MRLAVIAVASLAVMAVPDDESAAERMAVEINESGEQTMSRTDRSAEERAAKAGLAKQYSDALVDIMAVLLHGSESSKESAIERLVELAMDSGGHGSDQARMFRSAVVAGGALPVLIEEVQSQGDAHRQYLAATALHALALDDPTTDLDNFHSVEICQHGAVEALVALLRSEEEQLQHAATGALAQLAENPVCQQMVAAAGALEPLTKMATYGSDFHKLNAMNALEVLALNNPGARQQLTAQNMEVKLDGLATMGSGLLRKEAGAFRDALKTPLAASNVAAEEHVKQARQTRIRYDNVRRTAIKMMRGWDGRGGGRGRGRGAMEDDED